MSVEECCPELLMEVGAVSTTVNTDSAGLLLSRIEFKIVVGQGMYFAGRLL